MKFFIFRIGILLALASICGCGKNKVQSPKGQSDLITLFSALKSYKLLAGNYPTTEQGLEALCEKPEKSPIPKRWIRAVKEVPKDPWGRHYQYRYKDEKITLWSKGAMEDDPSDDIIFEVPEAKE